MHRQVDDTQMKLGGAEQEIVVAPTVLGTPGTRQGADCRPIASPQHLGAAQRVANPLAEQNGLKVVMNRCPKIEYGRLSSEIAWMGVNTRTISAKKAQLSGRGIQRMSLNRPTLAGGATPASARAQKEGS